MSLEIYKVYKQINKLNARINNKYNIEPRVYIRYGDASLSPNGTCITSYQRPSMYLEINLPENFKMTKISKVLLTVILIHEYCHYIEALSQTAIARKVSGVKYLKNNQARKQDEKKTWRQTKKMAVYLNLWSKSFYNRTQECIYASDLTY